MGINNCSLCLDKQRKIDELEDEVDRLKRALGKRKQDEKQVDFSDLRLLHPNYLLKQTFRRKRKSLRVDA